MFVYSIVFVKIAFTLITYASKAYGPIMSSNYWPFQIIADKVIFGRIGLSDLGLNANLQKALLIIALVVVYILWFAIATSLIVGLFSTKARKTGLLLASIVLLMECVASLFIYDMQLVINCFVVNLLMLIISVITLFRLKANR